MPRQCATSAEDTAVEPTPHVIKRATFWLVSAVVYAAVLTATHLAAPPIQAEAHPDFSGTWTLVTPEFRPWTDLGVTFSAAQIADALTVKYLVTGSNGLDIVWRSFSLNPSAKGSDSWPASMRVMNSMSSTAWRGASLVVQTRLILAPPDRAGHATTSRRPVNQTDVWSLGADGTLIINSMSSTRQTRRTVFKKIAAGDLVSLPVEPPPAAESPNADGTWLGGYRFGMAIKDARAIAACAGRKYDESNPGVLRCDGFPFAGMKLQMALRFDQTGLSSIRLTGEWGSEAPARKATDDLLAYLNRQFGTMSSLELGADSVATNTIWRNIDTQRHSGPYPVGVVRVLTPRRYISAIVTAEFMKGSITVRPTFPVTPEPGEIESRVRSGGEAAVEVGRPMGMVTYTVSVTIFVARLGGPSGP